MWIGIGEAAVSMRGIGETRLLAVLAGVAVALTTFMRWTIHKILATANVIILV